MWSQFRRWSRNGTWAQALTVLRAAAGQADGRDHATPSMVVIDTNLACGGACSPSTTAATPTAAKGAKRVVAVDVTGLPVDALVVSASTHENRVAGEPRGPWAVIP